ncbi:Uncharacterised protein [Myroides odoratus]|uniref:Uncharacterized protein n=1 Tax=Myroides odoratus TaxID=256 RepID=A0A378RI73_MYROD|nr:Uncharacterised protein [Myroides odoratus]
MVVYLFYEISYLKTKDYAKIVKTKNPRIGGFFLVILF